MGNRVLTVVLATLLVGVIVGGGLVYWLVLEPRSNTTVTYRIPELFLTDLAGYGHIRVELYAELGDRDVVKEMEKRKVEVVDAIYQVLRSKHREDLSGASGQDLLRSDLVQALREVLGTDQLLNLYFAQIVID